MSVLGFYFGWYQGAVYSNLLASAICAGLVWWRLRARMVLHHAEIRDLAARAHRIAADTHHRLTGEHHPDAPPRTDPAGSNAKGAP